MDDLTIKANLPDLREGLKEVPRVIKLALADGLDHATRSFYATFYKTRLQGPPGIRSQHGGIFHRFRRVVKVNGKAVFLRQSASQNESVRAVAKSAKNPMNMRIELYSQSKVAGIHETGGVISKPGMVIPLNDKAKQMLKSKVNLDTLVPFKINGKIFLGINRKTFGPELLFILKRSVRIKPRLAFYGTWDKHAGRRDQIINEALDEGMSKV
jgi:hypothetical protein